MLIDRLRAPIEPLFARHAAVWLRIWSLTQLVAFVTASCFAVRDIGSIESLFAGANAMRLDLTIVMLVAAHIAGVALHEWLLREGWRSIVYVAVCWGLVFSASLLQHQYSLLILGALLQACVFLPFQWVAGALVAFVVVDVVAVAHRRIGSPSANIFDAVPLLMLGVIVGTVVLYIHRSNRDAAFQDDLLRQLDAAQHDLAVRSREAGVLEERQRLSRDLHDTLAQGFTSVIAQLSAAELLLRSSNGQRNTSGDGNDAGVPAAEQAAPYLERAQAVSRQSLAEIRRLVLALRPTPLTDGPLPAALDRVVREWATLSGVGATFDARDVPELTPGAQITLLRAVQEALSNVARHASAHHVKVQLSRVDDLIMLEVDDDGVGAPDEVLGGSLGLGLAGMRERAAMHGGRVILEGSERAGTSLTVALPLETAMIVHQADPQ